MNRQSRTWIVGLSLSVVLVDCGGAAPTNVANPTPPIASARAVTSSACGDASGGHGDTAAVVAAALAFRDTLPESARANLEKPLTRANMIGWSNLPTGIVPRAGVRLGDLDAAQSAAARRLFVAATSACGLAMLDEVRLADEALLPLDTRKFGWGAANYYVALYGSPSDRAPWMLQIGGHHIAYNLVFNGTEVGATPLFVGTEPVRFKTADGKEHEPLKAQSSAMWALATALAAHPEARLSGTFTDVVKGVVIDFSPGKPPSGGIDTGFPFAYPSGAVDRGIRFDALAPDEQKRVRDALESFASLPGESMSRALVDAYEAPGALAATYVGHAGDADLAKIGMYVRIDGPRMWMEFVVQAGVAFKAVPHYHALWRDKVSDYGGEVKQ